MGILRFQRRVQRAGHDCAEFAENIGGAAAVGQPVEGEPDAVRRRHVVAIPDIAGFQAHRRRGPFAEGLVAELRHGIHGAHDFRADAMGAGAVEGVAGMGGAADDEGEGREFADRAQIDRTAFLAVALAARCIQIDAADNIEVEAASDLQQGIAQAAHAARAVLLVRRCDEEDVTVRCLQSGKTLQCRYAGGKAALHIEQAAPGDEIAALEILERLRLRTVQRAAAQFLEQGFRQRFRIAGERRQRAVIGDGDGIEMAGHHHRAPAAAAHQRHDILRHRFAMAVHGEELVGMAFEIGRFGKMRPQPLGESRFVRRTGDAWPAGHQQRKIFGAGGGGLDGIFGRHEGRLSKAVALR